MPKQRQSDGGGSFADLVKSKRKRENLTQVQASEAWGIPISTLTKWEQGICTPRGFALAAIKQLLGD